ncbi:hypothetical protein VIGAN_05188300 [Vigna angularis var. angularis]|uniref:RRM domain-containing protein n=1 Tax=Vigna angularis var. angularis TaxID=157739 RepID=A0A0S3S6C0_PHAAN|nr:hypothetical protein VIGAN_05188300 [Vigna angularis var. angularis]
MGEIGIIVCSLLLTPLPFTSDSAFRAELQAFGDIRALQTEALRHGILIVHFYDLCHAESAFAAIRSMHHHFPQVAPASPGLLSSRPISTQYVLPSSSSIPDAHNQGTLVVFNLDPHLSTDHLRRLFHPFGVLPRERALLFGFALEVPRELPSERALPLGFVTLT